jgi:hypothetical protein
MRTMSIMKTSGGHVGIYCEKTGRGEGVIESTGKVDDEDDGEST